MRGQAGFTVVEAIVAVAIISVLSLTIGSLFKAGIQTSTYALRQGLALQNAQSAVNGTSLQRGLAWAIRDGVSVSSLNASTLSLATWDSPSVVFTAGSGLVRSELGVPRLQARGVSALDVHYYNVDGSGRVVESTAAASAQLVTATATMGGEGQAKTYSFFTGAALRNR